MNSYPQLALTTAQRKRWDQTRVAFQWVAPAFGDIWYALMVDAKGELAHFTDQVPTAATNGKVMFFNPEDFLGGGDHRTLDHRVFITGHEVLHAAFNHPQIFAECKRRGKVPYADGTSLPYVDETMQIAADMFINDILVNGKIGTKPPDAQHDPRQVNENMSLFEAYRTIYKDQQGRGKRPGDDPGKRGDQPGGFDTHMEPGEGEGKSPDDAMSERNDGEWKIGVTAALEGARLRGKLPANIERLLLKVTEPEVDWKELLRATLARRVGNDMFTWSKLDENYIHRMIGAPGRVAYGAGHVVMAWDSSGSMTQRDMDHGATETAGVIEDVRPKRLTVLQCDARITDEFECDDVSDLKRRKIKGGGGTDFRPVFDWIDKDGEKVDALIYVTDSYGWFPEEQPDYPVIWLVTDPKGSAPWGDVIFAPIKAPAGA